MLEKKPGLLLNLASRVVKQLLTLFLRRRIIKRYSPIRTPEGRYAYAFISQVYNRIADVLEEASDANYDDGSYGPVLLRLAWHASGTYDKDTNSGGRCVGSFKRFGVVVYDSFGVGSNYATMRFEPEALHAGNKGLHIARGLMEKLKQEFSWISYGDLWTLGGVVAVQVWYHLFCSRPGD
jgi:catalase (peroxidase I)